MSRRDRLDRGDQMIDLRRAAVEFDDQQRLGIERIAGVNESLRRLDREPVHDLHAAGNDAGADDRGDAIARAFDAGKTDQQRARAGRRRQHAAP